jgi:hypothetical protein
VNGRFPNPANAKTLKRHDFPPAGASLPKSAPHQRGQRFPEIKPVSFKLLVYFGRRAIAGPRPTVFGPRNLTNILVRYARRDRKSKTPVL